MNYYENENSLSSISNSKISIAKNISLFNLKLIHKILDSINISLLISIFILSFISFNSQREWTNIYLYLSKRRDININLIDYISKTEEFYINEIESLDTFKKATPKDLIYVSKQISKKKRNYLNKKIKLLFDGLKESRYQIGY